MATAAMMPRTLPALKRVPPVFIATGQRYATTTTTAGDSDRRVPSSSSSRLLDHRSELVSSRPLTDHHTKRNAMICFDRICSPTTPVAPTVVCGSGGWSTAAAAAATSPTGFLATLDELIHQVQPSPLSPVLGSFLQPNPLQLLQQKQQKVAQPEAGQHQHHVLLRIVLSAKDYITVRVPANVTLQELTDLAVSKCVRCGRHRDDLQHRIFLWEHRSSARTIGVTSDRLLGEFIGSASLATTTATPPVKTTCDPPTHHLTLYWT